MWWILVGPAIAGATCEQACTRLGACVGQASAADVQECVDGCASGALPQAARDVAVGAQDCEQAILGIALVLQGEDPASMGAYGSPAAPTPAAPPAPAPGSPAACRKPASSQLSTLLTSTAWCSYSFSGDTERKGRVVLTADGRVSGSERSETVMTGQTKDFYGEVTATYGAWGSGSKGFDGCWDVVGNQLALSADGRAYAPGPTRVSRNSSGSPIVTFNGTEYMVCP